MRVETDPSNDTSRFQGASPGVATERHARMQLNALAVFVRGGECWHADIVDISATGILAQIPDGAFWKVDQQFRIEMIALDVGTISVEARLVRIDDDCAGFAFTAIPAGSQVPLWSLLGAFADRRDGAEATPRN